MYGFPAAPPPSPTLLTAVKQMRPVTTRRPWREVGWIVGCSLAFSGALMGVFHIAAGTTLQPLFAIAIVALFIVRVVSAIVPPPRTVLPRPRAPLALTITADVAIVIAMLIAHHAYFTATRPLLLVHAGWPCIWRGLALSALPIVIALIVSRRGLDRSWRTTLEICGAASALAGLGLLYICGSRDVAHIVLVHGGALIAALALGFFIVSWVRRSSY